MERENQVYEEVEQEKGMNIVSTKWILKEKENEGGRIWKARLVARCFTEKFGNRFECEAPTCSIEGLKLLLVVIKTFG